MIQASHARSVQLAVRSLLVGLAALALSLSCAGASLAATAHTYAGQFGSSGTGGGAFTPGGPNALTIEESSGDIFALDTARTNSEGLIAPRVERFDAAGNYQGSIAVDGTAVIFPDALAFDATGSGSIYVGGLDNANQTTGAVLKYSTAGALEYTLDPAGSETTLGYPVALAVDPGNGTVFVNAVSEATGLPVVDVFDNAGAFVSSFDGSSGSPDGAFGAISAFAVDAVHRLYVTDAAKGRVDRYGSSGEWQATVDDGSRGAPGAITADPNSSEVYVLEAGPLGQQVTRFSAGGAAMLESFGTGHINSAAGIAVTHSTGAVYTADAGASVIERFAMFLAPTVTTEAASAVEASEATLEGTINPEGVAGATTYRFEYGLDANYGSATPETDTGGGSADVPASATIASLTPGTVYHFRLVGTNDSGSSFGGDETFTTAAAAPAVDVQGPSVASAITTGGATFNDVVNPNGADATYRYEYGATTSYGASTPDGDAGPTTGESAAVTPVTGLQPGTTYHFRIVAENGIGAPVDGADATFTTAPATPPSASNIASNSATLNATVIPGVSGGSYRFEYGITTSYGASTPEQGLPAGTAEVPVGANALALTPGTTYHFRVVETVNATGQTVSSDDATFTTISAAAVTTEAITEVTPTTATLNATIDTHGVAGTYSFTVTSPDSPYATTTADAALSATSGPQSVSVALSGLPSEAEYVVRAAATVAGTTVWGEEGVFSTPTLPPFNPPAPPPSISTNPFGCVVVDCGTVSNTVGVAIQQAPTNAFTIAKVAIQGATATLSVKVSGPGRLEVTSAKTATASKTVANASTARLTIHLSKAGRKVLSKAKGKKFGVSVRVTFTPAAGTAASQTRTLTFKRGGTR